VRGCASHRPLVRLLRANGALLHANAASRPTAAHSPCSCAAQEVAIPPRDLVVGKKIGIAALVHLFCCRALRALVPFPHARVCAAVRADISGAGRQRDVWQHQQVTWT